MLMREISYKTFKYTCLWCTLCKSIDNVHALFKRINFTSALRPSEAAISANKPLTEEIIFSYTQAHDNWTSL